MMLSQTTLARGRPALRKAVSCVSSNPAVTGHAQSLRWIDAVGAPEELRKPARGAEAIAGGNPGDRLGAAGAQHLGPGLLEPDPPQGRHWRRAAEALERHLQGADAAPRSLRDLDNCL